MAGNSKTDMSNEAGFSLVEVLVTMVIISLVLIPLFQMQQVLDRSSMKLKQSTSLITSSDTILSFLTTINPMQEPKGSQNLAGLIMDWESKELETYNRPGSMIDPPQKIGLYDFRYTLKNNTGQNLETRTIKKMGWETSVLIE